MKLNFNFIFPARAPEGRTLPGWLAN